MTGDLAILPYFEALVRGAGSATCFYDSTHVDEDGYDRVTYRQLHNRASFLAYYLCETKGIKRGSFIAADMGNCPEFVYLLMAAAYGNYTLVALNTRLTEVEKKARLADVRRSVGAEDLPVFDTAKIADIIDKGGEGSDSGLMGSAALANWSVRATNCFDPLLPAVVMFTSGTSGKAKAASLTWENLTGAARASNASLNTRGEGTWQLALPMYHVGGMQIVFRSLLNGNPFVLYNRFDAQTVLRDAETYSVTHLSVVDKMLADLLRADDPQDSRLPTYSCLLLGGAAPNAALLKRAREAGVRVFVSYGMTETCSQVASALLTESFKNELTPLPGYSLLVLDADENGFGKLAVKGPGVFDGYLNARTVFTADGYFLTGDTARMAGRHVVVTERTTDMFVSGGENIYPEEIRSKLLSVSGVTDAYVFGAPDRTWGRRPAAFVEAAELGKAEDFDAFEFARTTKLGLQARLSKLYMPHHLVVVPEFPRTGIGKVDREQLNAAYRSSLRVSRVDVWRVSQPLIGGTRTAKVDLTHRDSLLVQVTDVQGRTGIAEGVAFDTDWYLPETLDEDLKVLEQHIVPALLGQAFLHPNQVFAVLEKDPVCAAHPLAVAAVEPALWDLFGKVNNCSLVELFGGRPRVSEPGAKRTVPAGCVPGGVVLGIADIQDTLNAVDEAVADGYMRVKLKIKPGHDMKVVEAVRSDYPNITLMLDANQSYTEEDIPTLRQLDAFDIACIEEPLDPNYVPKVGPRDIFDRLERLQGSLSMPVCIDESWSTAEELQRAMNHVGLRCYVMKIAKFGGIGPALEFYRRARSQGITLWMGGMYDTGVSKRLHAAFSTLPGINLPGDLSDTARYFSTEVCSPAFRCAGGMLMVNPVGYEQGLGCVLNSEAVDSIAVDHRVYE